MRGRTLWRLTVRRGRIGALALLASGLAAWATDPTAMANAAFDRYAAAVETQLETEHGSVSEFVALPAKGTDEDQRLRRGELLLERLLPNHDADPEGAMLHDWRGAAFIPGGKAADFEHVLRQFDNYSQRFAPEVLAARVVGGKDDELRVWMRVQQHHVLTVTLDTTYDVHFGRLDAQHGFSFSRSAQIAEIDHPGERMERALSATEQHGFLWRLNTYWSWEEMDGGLYVQIRSISLTRAIPAGLGWAIGSFVESVPRESLEFTLRSACAACAAAKRP